MKSALRQKWFNFRVMIKFNVDRLRLPLRPEHYWLYWMIHDQYHEYLGCFPDIVHCPSFNEQIQWLKLFDQDERIPQCVDKLAVRDYIKSRVDNICFPEVYQVVNKLEELDIDALPGRFVIKTNHDSGSVYPVRDKASYDPVRASEIVERYKGQAYGWEKGEWGYAFVKPRVFAEEYMQPVDNSVPSDYKFHCVDGRVRCMQYIYGRDSGWTREEVVDADGQSQEFALRFEYPGRAFQKPENWGEMISMAESIAEGFKYVRVDFYIVHSRIYFSEMTFWPFAGFYPGQGQEQFSRFIDIDRTRSKPPIYLNAFKRET